MISFKRFINSKPRISKLGTSVLISQGYHSTAGKNLTEENIFDSRKESVKNLRNINKKTFSSVNKMHNTLSNYYNFINPEDINHITRYTGDSTLVNRDLYNHFNSGGSSDEIPEHADKAHIKGLDDSLNAIRTSSAMSVYSGTGFHPGIMANKNKFNRLHLPAYTSTSIDPVIASKFAKGLVKNSENTRYIKDKDFNAEGADHHILKIDLPANHPGAYVSKHSDFGEDEKEFLLPRNTSLKIHPVPEIRMFQDGNNVHRMHIWHAKPV